MAAFAVAPAWPGDPTYYPPPGAQKPPIPKAWAPARGASGYGSRAARVQRRLAARAVWRWRGWLAAHLAAGRNTWMALTLSGHVLSSPTAGRDLMGEVSDAVRRWMVRRGLPHAFAWVVEAGPALGDHAHAIIAAPPGAGDARDLRAYVAGVILAALNRRGGAHLRKLPPRAVVWGGRWGVIGREDARRWGAYLVRGLVPAGCEVGGVRGKPGAWIAGRRFGLSALPEPAAASPRRSARRAPKARPPGAVAGEGG